MNGVAASLRTMAVSTHSLALPRSGRLRAHVAVPQSTSTHHPQYCRRQ